MGFLKRSLMARLLVCYMLLTIVPLAAIGYIGYYSGRQAMINSVEAHLGSVVTLKEQEMQRWLKHLNHAVAWVAESPRVINDVKVMAAHSDPDTEYQAAHDSLVNEFQRISSLEQLPALLLLNIAGGQITAASDISWEGKFRENESYFLEGKKGSYVSDRFYSLTLSQPTMVASAPVKDSSGQLLAVIAAHANLGQLTEVMTERSGLGETGETYLVSKNNLLLTESRFEPGVAFRKWVFTEGVSRALKGESGTSLYLDYRGEPIIGTYRWIESMGLVLLTEIDQSEAFAPVYDLRNIIVGVAGIVFVITAGVEMLFVRQITRPLSRLADYAERVGRGEYTAEVEIRGKDEVAAVATGVKIMVGQLLEMQERLLISERLAILGQFSGSISHELRNPLGVIDSSVYYLKTKLKDADAKVREHLDRIKSSVGNSNAIIESLLNLTRMKEPKVTRLDLRAATSDAIAAAKIPASLNVIQDLPEQEVLVDADQEQLRMAFKNIINNANEAMEAMDGNGTLTVTVGRTADGGAVVSFADTGTGIAAEDLDRVFQPLFSNKAKGIGFGLSIAKMVIDKHGGTIQARSEPGKWAIITLWLPPYKNKEAEV